MDPTFVVSSLCMNPLAPIQIFVEPSVMYENSSRNYWLRVRVGFAAWDMLERLGLTQRISLESWQAPVSDTFSARWPAAELVAFAVPPTGALPYSLHIPIQSLVVGNAALVCGVRALEYDQEFGADFVPFYSPKEHSLGAPGSSEGLELVAILSDTRTFSNKIVSLDGNLWRRFAASLVAHEIESDNCNFGDIRSSRPQLAGTGTVLKIKTKKPHSFSLPKDLTSHPLWRAMIPLFSDSVRPLFEPL